PTMIYGDPHDGNLSNIARIIRWFGFYPIVGRGDGLRQPIHVSEVADSCLSVLKSTTLRDTIYEISGGEVLSYKQMVIRVFEYLGRKPLILSLPLKLFRIVIKIVTKFGMVSSISPSMADRMNRDLCFGHERAAKDFGFKPGSFYYR
ncbi:NAD(P)-dependent oxidoreductase, partial [Pseudomonadota bacterium]